MTLQGCNRRQRKTPRLLSNDGSTGGGGGGCSSSTVRTTSSPEQYPTSMNLRYIPPDDPSIEVIVTTRNPNVRKMSRLSGMGVAEMTAEQGHVRGNNPARNFGSDHDNS